MSLIAKDPSSERRRANRHSINRVALFHPGNGGLPKECTVTDISDRGASSTSAKARLIQRLDGAVHSLSIAQAEALVLQAEALSKKRKQRN